LTSESRRILARSFGSAAAEYERGRPGWPVEAVDAVGLPSDAEVLDLAAGTGKLTRVLERRFARVVEHEQVLSRALLVDYYASISWVASLPAARRSRAVTRFAGALDRDEYRRTLRAEVYWAQLA
jgi:hypothetical protein